MADKPRKKNHKASKTQRYHLSGALGPPRRSKNKGQMSPGGGQATHVPPYRDTPMQVHPWKHTRARTQPGTRAHTRSYGHTCVRAQPPACVRAHAGDPCAPIHGSTCSCVHMPLTHTHAFVCTPRPCFLEARWGAQGAPELQGLAVFG